MKLLLSSVPLLPFFGPLDLGRTPDVYVSAGVRPPSRDLWRRSGGTTITVERSLLEKIEDEMSPRGERQGGNDERERVKLTALVPVPV